MCIAELPHRCRRGTAAGHRFGGGAAGRPPAWPWSAPRRRRGVDPALGTPDWLTRYRSRGFADARSLDDSDHLGVSLALLGIDADLDPVAATVEVIDAR
ncbi:MAG: hypothetical protein IPM29_22250 [Planctomycetes bacterium]|nr:hypothetical protein [Planctomycetota bacterium]